MQQNKWFIIEGNIGSGKTTLLEKLNENINYEVIKEPVDLWQNIKGDNNKNILQSFYEDPKRYAYLFQTIVFKTRLQSLDHPQIKPVRFSERSIWTDRNVFGKLCINMGNMNELEKNAYYSWFNWLEDKFFRKPDGIIYVYATPTTCNKRMKERNRVEESEVPLEYLKETHKYHEEWLQNKHNVFIINNDDNDNWDEKIKQIEVYIKSI